MARRERTLRRTGRVNVTRVGVKHNVFSDIYHFLISISWARFLGVVALVYLAANLLFGVLYFECGPGAIEGTQATTTGMRFWECFFFSVQTLATIGYGRVSPVGLGANFLVTIEALFGMLQLALATGLLYARFAKPTARIRFSETALITTIDGERVLIFRMANERSNQIVDAQVNVVLIVSERTKEGETYRNLYDLKLERHRTPMFGLGWLVLHPIDSNSPLFGKTAESLQADEAELIVSVTGIDETVVQMVHSRFSYIPEEILWDKYFADIFGRTEDGRLLLDLNQMDKVIER